DVSSSMEPGFAISAKSIFRSAEYIACAACDGQYDSEYDHHLRRQVHEETDRKQLFITAETGSVDANRVVDGSNPDQRRHAGQLEARIGFATQREYQPCDAHDRDQNQKYLGERRILPERFAENHWILLLYLPVSRKVHAPIDIRRKNFESSGSYSHDYPR